MGALTCDSALDVSYKTAWCLCHRIRAAMHEAHPELLDGIVEVDETYIGGKKRGNGRGNYRPYKTAVIAAVKAKSGAVSGAGCVELSGVSCAPHSAQIPSRPLSQNRNK